MVAPVLKSVTLVEAREQLSAGARWLDVRYPDEQAGSSRPDSLDLPLNVLRQRAQSLDPSRRYIACCDNGIRGAVAAFLVTDAGCDCVYLGGGLEAYPELSPGRPTTEADAAPVGAPGLMPTPPPPRPKRPRVASRLAARPVPMATGGRLPPGARILSRTILREVR